MQKLGIPIAAMNSFCKLEVSAIVTPDYYFVIDPLIWADGDRDSAGIRSYLADRPEAKVIQPVSFARLQGEKTLFVETLKNSGFTHNMDPTKRSSFPESVALTAIQTLKWLGYSPIYFAGLDSSVYKHYYIDALNRLNADYGSTHLYSKRAFEFDSLQGDISSREILAESPLRGMKDVFYSNAVFYLAMERLCDGVCINVGTSDITNDVAPRASLWLRD